MAESFPLFSQLPYELRSEIWKLAVVDPARIIHLQQRNSNSSNSRKRTIPSLFKSRISTPALEPLRPQAAAYRSRYPHPALLSTCSESRALALPFYTLAFGSPTHPPTTYFNFSRDALYLSYAFLRDAVKPSGAFNTDLRADIRKVKGLLIGGVWTPFSQTPWNYDFLICLIATLAAFGALEYVVLVNGKHREDERELVVLNQECPYECWEWHEDGRETTCLRERDPDWVHLQNYGECMRIQEPPGLEIWPYFSFVTVVPKGSEPRGKGWGGLRSRTTKSLARVF